jgi:hypothetical protein
MPRGEACLAPYKSAGGAGPEVQEPGGREG